MTIEQMAEQLGVSKVPYPERCREKEELEKRQESACLRLQEAKNEKIRRC